MAHPLLAIDSGAAARPIWLVDEETWAGVRDALPAPARTFAEAQSFEPKPGRHCLVPNADGTLFGVLFGLNAPSAKRADPFLVGSLPPLLPEGTYRFANSPAHPSLATLAWLLGAYAFTI